MKNKIYARYLFVLLTAGITAATMSFAVSAADFSHGTCGENLTWSLSDSTLTISGSGDMYDYNRFETPWNPSASVIRKVVTGDEVTRIGANAFYGCENLTEVVLGRGVASVGEFAFRECSALHTFTPGDATRTVNSAFFDTDLLTTIHLRNSVTELHDTFRDMDTVTSFTVDDTDGTGFYMVGDTLYHREIIDGDEIKTLYKYPEGKQLTGTYIPEDDTDIIGDKAFYYQELLEEVILPESTYKIEEFAFCGCSSLHTFTPGDATKTINSAFSATDLLTTIRLRNSVTELHDTFRDMDSVTAFEVDDTDGYGYYSLSGVLYHYAEEDNEIIKTLIKYPEGNQREDSYTAESGTTIIGEKAFYNQKLLTNVFLPETVRKLSAQAFYGCEILQGVYFYGKPPVSMVSSALPAPSTGLILYYIEGTDGWTDPWKNYDTDVFIPAESSTGDVNGDSVTDDADIQILIRYMAGWLHRFSNYLNAFLNPNDLLDFNNDDVFSPKDIMILNRYLNGWDGYAQYFE